MERDVLDEELYFGLDELCVLGGVVLQMPLRR